MGFKSKFAIFILLSLFNGIVLAQNEVSKVWVADLGNGKYKNPVLHADYSDPDVIRVGDDFYMVSSSFNAAPALPILHSKDLVNWKIIGHALKHQIPFDHFSKTQNGNGVWAPSIRFHNDEFYIYYPDPDFGIYLIKAKNVAGPWSTPVLVEAGKGLIDPCPLWDDNGKVYLAHAYAGSRAGIKSILVVKQMNSTGDKVIDEGKLVYDGHELDPTIEGPKFYKRNGFYYIFAPGGGVATGWQTVLRAKNIYGPYERKVVLHQGKTTINGPHQGAWVNTPTNEDWFLHFQDKGAYGRVVHLQPMKWINNWPVIGNDEDGDGIGEPVITYQKPNVIKQSKVLTPAESDEFNDFNLGLQWQWQANPLATWSFLNPTKGTLRLYSMKIPDSAKNYWEVPNLLLQKFPAEVFTAPTKLHFTPNLKLENEKTGLIVSGLSYVNIAIKSKKDGIYLVYTTCKEADKGKSEIEQVLTKVKQSDIYLRLSVTEGAKCVFSYSFDGNNFTNVADVFQAEPGKWIGAKVGLFCTREQQINDSGYTDVDWFRVN
jgi:beta-xylosidase